MINMKVYVKKWLNLKCTDNSRQQQ